MRSLGVLKLLGGPQTKNRRHSHQRSSLFIGKRWDYFAQIGRFNDDNTEKAACLNIYVHSCWLSVWDGIERRHSTTNKGKHGLR